MTASNSLPRLLTYREAAGVLGVTSRTVWQLVNDGVLQAVRIGRLVRIDEADLRAFIDSAKSGGDDHAA